MATHKELIAQQRALEARLEEARASEVASVIEKIRGLLAEYGLSVDDVALKRLSWASGKHHSSQERTAATEVYGSRDWEDLVGKRPGSILAWQATGAISYSRIGHPDSSEPPRQISESIPYA